MSQDSRPVRGCDVCGQVDDHPRHVIGQDYLPAHLQAPTSPEVAAQMVGNAPDATAVTAILAHVQDNTTILRHMDCCAAVGCPDKSCDVTLDGSGKQGAALVKHIGADDTVQRVEKHLVTNNGQGR